MLMTRRAAVRQAHGAARSIHPQLLQTRQQARHIGSAGPGTNGKDDKPAGKRGGFLTGFLVAFCAAGAVMTYPSFVKKEAPKPPQATIEYEKPRAAPVSKEDNRDLISSQHLQVKKSWENPGVYAWGSNTGKVVAPDLADSVVKTPRRLSYFDGQLLRDLKLDREFGAAITEKGDLVQWGIAFSKENPTPVPTLKGKDLIKLGISRDRIIALSKNGNVFSVPVASNDQTAGKKVEQSSWFSFWSSTAPVSYRELRPSNLGWGEKVVDVSSGLEHALMLTSSGRVFSAASSTSDFPSKGQLGVPGLSWETRPKGPYDQPHEVLPLKGFKISQIAAGDFHSLTLDADGRVFVFGDNTSGQLGFEPEREYPFVAAPFPLPFSKIYAATGQHPRVTSVAAGGANSFFTVDATRVVSPKDDPHSVRDIGRVTADTWACGSGLMGSLGTGRWTHVSLGPTKIKSLSGLFEWDEKTNSVIPIRLTSLNVGSTHAAAVMANVTSTDAQSGGASDINWGADVVWWGGNEHYQLGTGKRNNVSLPTYISALDGGRADAEKGRKGEEHRFQITPRTTTVVGRGSDGKGGRKVSVEQRIECGRFVTAVYSGT